MIHFLFVIPGRLIFHCPCRGRSTGPIPSCKNAYLLWNFCLSTTTRQQCRYYYVGTVPPKLQGPSKFPFQVVDESCGTVALDFATRRSTPYWFCAVFRVSHTSGLVLTGPQIYHRTQSKEPNRIVAVRKTQHQNTHVHYNSSGATSPIHRFMISDFDPALMHSLSGRSGTGTGDSTAIHQNLRINF